MATAYGVTDAQQDPRPQVGCGKWALWSAKGLTSVGAINVTTLYAPGRLQCVIQEINRYRWDVLGVSETHWVGEGEMVSDGIKILYSGRMDNIHRQGVALFLGPSAQNAYKEHNCVSPRIVSVTLNGVHKNV